MKTSKMHLTSRLQLGERSMARYLMIFFLPPNEMIWWTSPKHCGSTGQNCVRLIPNQTDSLLVPFYPILSQISLEKTLHICYEYCTMNRFKLSFSTSLPWKSPAVSLHQFTAASPMIKTHRAWSRKRRPRRWRTAEMSWTWSRVALEWLWNGISG